MKALQMLESLADAADPFAAIDALARTMVEVELAVFRPAVWPEPLVDSRGQRHPVCHGVGYIPRGRDAALRLKKWRQEALAVADRLAVRCLQAVGQHGLASATKMDLEKLMQALAGLTEWEATWREQGGHVDTADSTLATAIDGVNTARASLRPVAKVVLGDEDEYMPAKECLDLEHVKTYGQLRKILEQHPEIRRKKPSKQRLLVHTGDWSRWLASLPLVTDADVAAFLAGVHTRTERTAKARATRQIRR